MYLNILHFESDRMIVFNSNPYNEESAEFFFMKKGTIEYNDDDRNLFAATVMKYFSPYWPTVLKDIDNKDCGFNVTVFKEIVEKGFL